MQTFDAISDEVQCILQKKQQKQDELQIVIHISDGQSHTSLTLNEKKKPHKDAQNKTRNDHTTLTVSRC